MNSHMIMIEQNSYLWCTNTYFQFFLPDYLKLNFKFIKFDFSKQFVLLKALKDIELFKPNWRTYFRIIDSDTGSKLEKK
jgi:hypothetical protein